MSSFVHEISNIAWGAFPSSISQTFLYVILPKGKMLDHV